MITGITTFVYFNDESEQKNQLSMVLATEHGIGL